RAEHHVRNREQHRADRPESFHEAVLAPGGARSRAADRTMRRGIRAIIRPMEEPPRGKTQVDSLLDRVKNNRYAAIAIVVGVAIVGVSTVYKAIADLVPKLGGASPTWVGTY